MYLKQVNKNAVVNTTGESMTPEDKKRDDQMREHKGIYEPFSDIPWKDITGASDLLRFADSLGDQAFVAGGAVASCLYGSLDDCGDVDVWFNSLDKLKDTAHNLYKGGYNYENGADDVANLREDPHTINYVNMVPASSTVPINKKIQLVKRRWYHDCLSVIHHFDLLHCKVGFQVGSSFFATTMVVSVPGAVKACQDKTIYVTGSLYPGHLMSRMKKYRARGFKFPDCSDWPEFDDKPAAAPEPLLSYETADVQVHLTDAQPLNKFDNPAYWADYQNLSPEDFRRKWS